MPRLLNHVISPLLWILIVHMDFVRAGSIPGVALNGTLNLAFLGYSSLTLRAGIQAGFNVAIRTIKERQLLTGYDIDFYYWDSGCNPNQGEH